MPVIDTLQSSSKEMKHTQDSRIAIPSNHCITFSKYGKHGDMRGVEKSSPKLSTLGTYQPKLWDGGAKSNYSAEDFTAQCHAPTPTALTQSLKLL